MISWDTPPSPEDKAASMMDDAFLRRAYQRTTGELGVLEAIALLAGTDQRRLDV